MPKHYISADDIHNLFYRSPKARPSLTWGVIASSILIVVAVFLIINGPAYWQQLSFWWTNDVSTSQPYQQAINNQSPALELPATTENSPAPTNNQPAGFSPEKIADNSLAIPKIKVSAPIIWDITAGNDINTDMLNALQQGVVRYPQTALPNQIGNIFLTGHSSNYWWDKGHYKTIFALLDRLVAGDMIYIKYQGRVYNYRVTTQKVVQPTETSVLNPTSVPTLNLMTCTPTGTSLRRRVVTARLLNPTDTMTFQTTSPNGSALQAVR